MREFLKSTTLVVLVALSVLQMSLFIQQQTLGPQRFLKPVAAAAATAVGEEQLTRPPAELVTPPRVIAHLGGEKHALLRASSGFYTNIWNNIWRSSIAKDKTMSFAAFKEVEHGRWDTVSPSVEMILSHPTPLDLWLRALGVKLEGVSGRVPVVNRIYVSAVEDNQIIIEDIEIDRLYVMPVEFKAEILSKFLEVTAASVYYAQVPLSPKIFAIPFANPIYVYTKAPLVAPRQVEVEPTIETDRLLTAYFPDPSMVRLYKDSQGNETYYDGVRMLKRLDGLRRLATLEDSSGVRSDAEDNPLLVMARWTTRLQQWAEGEVSFDGQQLQDNGEVVTYYQQAYQGKPVFRQGTAEGAIPTIRPSYTVRSEGDTLLGFERDTAKIGASGTHKEALDAIFALAVVDDRWDTLFPGHARSEKKLRDIYEAFLVGSEPMASPVWCVEFYDGSKVLVDIYDSRVRGIMLPAVDR
ncbi:MAG: hypothetical protein ACM3ZQ_11145 [Bacillota bacterium]